MLWKLDPPTEAISVYFQGGNIPVSIACGTVPSTSSLQHAQASSFANPTQPCIPCMLLCRAVVMQLAFN
jgi:hypothetical protein